MHILVLDDEREVREGVTARLERDGHVVSAHATLASADAALLAGAFDVLVLDRALPDGDVLSRLPGWQRSGSTARVLLLTASGTVGDRVDGLNAGADDYLVKPFALAELVARVGALGRRPATGPLHEVRVGDVTVRLSERRVQRAGVELPLRPKEFAVLEALCRRAPRPVSREQLRSLVWDDDPTATSNVEEVTIASLRRKLGEPSVIRTVRGVGWQLVTE